MQTLEIDRSPQSLILWGMILIGLGLFALTIAVIALLMFGWL